ncbi:MAG: FliG C-terminal domain-containing protein [Planctomycetota bacterium]
MKPIADNSLRDAALFVQNLAPDAAHAMLGRLTADEASALRAAIAELAVDNTDLPTPRASQSDDGTVELQLGTSASDPVATAPVAAQRVARDQAKPSEPLFDGAAWLRSLDDADPQAIAEYLSQEHPRAIAVVLSYLSARLAAEVLQSLATDEQAKVVAQLAEQGDADPDSLRVIASGLSQWIQQRRDESERRLNSVATIRQILAATPVEKRAGLLAGLTTTEPEVAAALSDLKPAPKPPRQTEGVVQPTAPVVPAIPFEQLHRVDSRALAKAVGSLDGRTALLALAGAPETLVTQLTSGLPRHAVRDLRARLHRVGPTTLGEIDRAQASLAMAVSRVVAARRVSRSAPKAEV